MVSVVIAAYKCSCLSKIIDEAGQLLGTHGSMILDCQLAVYVHGRRLKLRTQMTVKTAIAATTEMVAI